MSVTIMGASGAQLGCMRKPEEKVAHGEGRGEAQTKHQAHTDTGHMPPRHTQTPGTHRRPARASRRHSPTRPDCTPKHAHVHMCGGLPHPWGTRRAPYHTSARLHKEAQVHTQTHVQMSPTEALTGKSHTTPGARAYSRAHPCTHRGYSSTNSNEAHTGGKVVSKCSHHRHTNSSAGPQTHGRHTCCV